MNRFIYNSFKSNFGFWLWATVSYHLVLPYSCSLPRQVAWFPTICIAYHHTVPSCLTLCYSSGCPVPPPRQVAWDRHRWWQEGSPLRLPRPSKPGNQSCTRGVFCSPNFSLQVMYFTHLNQPMIHHHHLNHHHHHSPQSHGNHFLAPPLFEWGWARCLRGWGSVDEYK